MKNTADGSFYMDSMKTSDDDNINSAGSISSIESAIATESDNLISTTASSLHTITAFARIDDITGRISTIAKVLSKLLRTKAARYFTHNEFDKYADELDDIVKELDSYV